MQTAAPNMGASTGDAWVITADQKLKYDKIFDGLKPLNGILSGDKVKPVLINSKLPVADLSRVWDLSDIDKDGHLDRDEFAVAMYLVYRALEKHPVPATLPPNVIPPSKRGAVDHKASLPGAVPVLPTLGAGTAGATSTATPLVGANPVPTPATAMTGSGSIPLSMGTTQPLAPTPAQVPWCVTPQELTKYEEMHRIADTDMDGFVNGAEIKNLFMQSGLAQPVLAHIWNLCDTLNTGKLNVEQFALAMHLVQQKVAGVEPPTKLPPEMVPPSMRQIDGSGAPPHATDTIGMKELDMISEEIEKLKQTKMSLDQERAQKEADIKIRNGEVQTLQKELDAINVTVHMLDKQKAEAQKRLDDLDEKKRKLHATVKELQDKVEEEEKQTELIKQTIATQESSKKTQEEELGKLMEELSKLRQEEVELEQKVQDNNKQLDELNRNTGHTNNMINQSKARIEQLKATQEQMQQCITQYEGLIKGEENVTEPTTVELNAIDSLALPQSGDMKADLSFSDLASKTSPSASASASTDAVQQHDDPFQGQDPFAGSASGETDDPFQGSDPFKSDPFSGSDPFAGEGFTGGATEPKKPAGDMFDNAFDKDPFANAVKTTTAKNDPFDPWGNAPAVTAASDSDPFGTEPFQPGGKPKKAPPRPPPMSKSPKPSRPPAPDDPFGGKDPFGGGKSDSSGFADFSQSKFSSSPAPTSGILDSDFTADFGTSDFGSSSKAFSNTDFSSSTSAAAGFDADFSNASFGASSDPAAPPAPTTAPPLPAANPVSAAAAAPSPASDTLGATSDQDALEWARKDSATLERERQKRLELQEQQDLEMALALSRAEMSNGTS